MLRLVIASASQLGKKDMDNDTEQAADAEAERRAERFAHELWRALKAVTCPPELRDALDREAERDTTPPPWVV